MQRGMHRGWIIHMMDVKSVSDLPHEIILTIFNYLEASTLGRCCRVCKKWNHIGSEDFLWKQQFPNLSYPKGTLAKKYLQLNFITKGHIVLSLKEFSKKVSLYEKGVFMFIPYSHPHYTLYITLVHGRENSIAPNKELIVSKTHEETQTYIDKNINENFSTNNCCTGCEKCPFDSTSCYYRYQIPKSCFHLKEPILEILNEWKQNIENQEANFKGKRNFCITVTKISMIAISSIVLLKMSLSF